MTAPSPEPPDAPHGTPTKQHGDPLLDAAQHDGDGPGQGAVPTAAPDAPTAG